MTPRRTRLELPLLLPDVPDARDACVRRLEGLLGEERGVVRVHTVAADGGGEGQLCLHYDPEIVTLAQVERLAHSAGARISDRFGHEMLALRAIDGEDAARRIEADLESLDGVLEASVNLAAQRVRIEYERDRVSVPDVVRMLEELGYPAERTGGRTAEGEEPGRPSEPGEPAAREEPEATPSWLRRNKELALSLTGGALLAVAWVGSRWLGLPVAVAIGLYVASYVFGAWDLVGHWVAHVRKGKVTFDIDLLMLLAALGAAALGEWVEGAFLLFLFSLAHALEHYALGRARNAIKALGELAPARARVLRGGRAEEVPVEAIAAGEVVLVRPGERIPVDGVVREGNSAVNQAPITGESVPVDKEPGAEVFAGTVNGDGSLQVETTRAVGDRTLDRVVQLVEEAQTQKAPTQRFTDRFERVFVPAVLVADALLIVVPPLLGIWPLSLSFYRGMALLVASSPCALALGTPAAVLAGIAQAARNGVLIKGGAHLEHLGSVRALALDKTGTLTEGKPRVTRALPFEGVTEEELVRTAAAVEQQSQHPLAEAVVRRAEEMGLALPDAGALESVTARGVRAEVEGEVVSIGNLRLWEDGGTAVPDEIRAGMDRLQGEGSSVMAVAHGRRWLGVIGLADRPREGAREVLERLHELGIRRVVMLTGDNRGVAEVIARELGVDDVRAELLPEDKVVAIRELVAEHDGVAMVGDGVNDAPALANATIGIAMGGAGTAVALETADVALMADDLGKLPFAVGLSRKSRSVIRQNLGISLAVIALLIVATTTGLFGIGPAVIVHEGSTLLVVANALRLLNFKG
jgi:Cd2+/Zn2+-exporting ATPase